MTSIAMKWKLGSVLALPLMLGFAAQAWFGADAATGAADHPKKVFVHCVGCWPVGSGSLWWEKNVVDPKMMRHDMVSKSGDRDAEGRDTMERWRRGGHVRNWDLVPAGTRLDAEASADLEIRRTVRIGVDGIAVDAWCGTNNARETLEALFKAAEAKNYPIELTICVDPTTGGDLVQSVKYVLEKYGKSSKLARRNGKPLIFTYMPIWFCLDYLNKKLPGKSAAEVQRLRTNPEGWDIMGQAFADAEAQIGQPIYWHFCMAAFFHGVDSKVIGPETLVNATGAMAKHVSAVGSFIPTWGDRQAEAGKKVKEANAEWSAAVGWYQKENIPYELYVGKGLDWMCEQWSAVRPKTPRCCSSPPGTTTVRIRTSRRPTIHATRFMT